MNKAHWNTVGYIVTIVGTIAAFTATLASLSSIITIVGVIAMFVGICTIERTEEPKNIDDDVSHTPGPRFY